MISLVRRSSLPPISQEVRAALDRIQQERPGLRAVYLVPSPKDPALPLTKDIATRWLLQGGTARRAPEIGARVLASLPAEVGDGTETPVRVDVAAAGGWTGTDTLVRCYQQADNATMLAVVLGGGQRREKQA
jgi:hypothetical protein